MRTGTMLPLAFGVILGACTPPVEPATDGTLSVSTVTVGDDPDRDGLQLTIDGVNSVTLGANDTNQVIMPAGPHALGLVGVAGQCSVDPGTPLDVDIAPQETTPVAFRLTCPAIGARVTVATTGLDIDQYGYRIAVDGVNQAPISPNAVAFIRARPGSRTIALTGLAPNCASAGPDSRTVTIAPDRLTPVEFAVVCTATTGLIELSVSASGSDVLGDYEVAVDGLWRTQHFTESESFGIFVSGGDHLVQLAASAQCTVLTPAQSVNVTVGGLVRDTVAVNFAVSCTQSPGSPWDYLRAVGK